MSSEKKKTIKDIISGFVGSAAALAVLAGLTTFIVVTALRPPEKPYVRNDFEFDVESLFETRNSVLREDVYNDVSYNVCLDIYDTQVGEMSYETTAEMYTNMADECKLEDTNRMRQIIAKYDAESINAENDLYEYISYIYGNGDIIVLSVGANITSDNTERDIERHVEEYINKIFHVIK